jgi:hypothetical protein
MSTTTTLTISASTHGTTTDRFLIAPFYYSGAAQRSSHFVKVIGLGEAENIA